MFIEESKEIMEQIIQKNKEEFVNLLLSTKRPGIENVIKDIEELGFFEAPASTRHHLNLEGGLVQHSLNTYYAAISVFEGLLKIDPLLEREIDRERIIIASLLHDVCKSDIYIRTVRKYKSNIGTWEDAVGYKTSYKNFPMGHGEKSVVMLLCSGLELYEDEMLAIRWHMGPWGLNMNSDEDKRNYDIARKLHPLVTIIQTADNLAAALIERTGTESDDF